MHTLQCWSVRVSPSLSGGADVRWINISWILRFVALALFRSCCYSAALFVVQLSFSCSHSVCWFASSHQHSTLQSRERPRRSQGSSDSVGQGASEPVAIAEVPEPAEDDRPRSNSLSTSTTSSIDVDPIVTVAEPPKRSGKLIQVRATSISLVYSRSKRANSGCSPRQCVQVRIQVALRSS